MPSVALVPFSVRGIQYATSGEEPGDPDLRIHREDAHSQLQQKQTKGVGVA